LGKTQGLHYVLTLGNVHEIQIGELVNLEIVAMGQMAHFLWP